MFRTLTEHEVLSRLTHNEVLLLIDFQKYLISIRSYNNNKEQKYVPLREAYDTAWKLGFRDFQEGTMSNLYGIDYDKEQTTYQALCRAGLDQAAQLRWIQLFNSEIEFPTHPSFWGKGKNCKITTNTI